MEIDIAKSMPVLYVFQINATSGHLNLTIMGIIYI